MGPMDFRLTHLIEHDIDIGDATPIDKPNAKPFSWHIDHTKLAHTADSTIIELNPTNDQSHKLQTKAKIQYPIEHPAQHRHDLRSKQRAENQ